MIPCSHNIGSRGSCKGHTYYLALSVHKRHIYYVVILAGNLCIIIDKVLARAYSGPYAFRRLCAFISLSLIVKNRCTESCITDENGQIHIIRFQTVDIIRIVSNLCCPFLKFELGIIL